jgi:hypothetical protein
MRLFFTAKGAALEVEEKTLRFTDGKGGELRAGHVVVNGPAAGGSQYSPEPPPIAGALAAFLRAARRGPPDEVWAWFPDRKLGWPTHFCEAFRFGASVLFLHAPKPAHWYALYHLHVVGARFDDEAQAVELLARMRAANAPETLSFWGGQKGTYAHNVAVRLDDGSPVDVAATWVGPSFAHVGEHKGTPKNAGGYQVERCGSVAAAAARLGAWLADQLIAGRTLHQLVLWDEQLVLDRDGIRAALAELEAGAPAPAAKAPAAKKAAAPRRAATRATPAKKAAKTRSAKKKKR